MKRHSILPAILAVLGSPLAGAAEGEQSLPEMTVSGARPAFAPSLPAVAEGVTAERLAEQNVINVEDGLRYLPSLLVRKRFIGDRNGVVASRSSSTRQGARSLVYVDGMLISNLLGNSFSNAPRWGMAAPEEIERMDVAYGPYSALYPGNAMGATVLMTTRTPQALEGSGRVQLFRQHYDYYRTDEVFSGHQETATLGSRHGAFSWFVSASHIENRSHPQGWATATRSTTPAGGGDTVVTGYDMDTDPSGRQRVVFGATSIDDSRQDNFKIKLGYDVTSWLKLTYLFGHWRSDSEVSVDSYLRNAAGGAVYSGNVNIGGFRYAISGAAMRPSLSDETHNMHGLSLRTNTRGEWDFEAALTHYEFAADRTRQPSTALPAAAAGGAGTASYGDGTGWRTADARAVWRPAGSGHELTFGAHYDRYILSTLTMNATNWIAAATTTRKDFFGGKSATTALYVQDAWKFLPAWTLTAGLRYERWKAFDGELANATSWLTYARRSESFLSPKLSLSHDLDARWRLRASLGRAYRMPTVSEMFQGSISAGSIINSDPNLRAERATSAELTAERALDNGLLRLTLFRDDVRDTLFSQTNVTVFPNVTNIQNIDKVRTDGIELAYNAENVFVRGLDVSGGLTYADAEILKNDKFPASVGERMPRIPDWRLNASATWRQSEKLAWTLGLRHSGRQHNTLDGSDINPDTYGGTSRYTLWDARVNWKLDKHVRLAIGVDNLTDQRAFVHHPYPARTWLLELRGTL